MNLLLTGGTEEARSRLQATLDGVCTVQLVPVTALPAAPRSMVVSLDPDPDACRSLRELIGPAGFLIVLAPESELPPAEEMVAAGVDEVAASEAALAARLPFIARRFRDRESRERRLGAILDTTVDGIIVIDEQGLIETVNAAAERIFGYKESELIGRNVSVLMPEPFKVEHDSYIQNYLQTGLKRVIGIGREVIGRRKDGSIFPMDLAVSEVRVDRRSTFAGVVRDISERRRLESEILRISDQERRRIGQDLHDGLGQMLTGIGLISKNLAGRLRRQQSDAADELEEITELIRDADQQARSLARGLVPVELDANGLAAALQRLSVNAERLFGITCTFEEAGSEPVRESTVATNLYRIAQEAVSNAVRHGQADLVRVTLASGREQVRLRILDNGIGFPDELGEDRGMGVRIMHYRASVIGGQLEIRRRPEGGTVVTCTTTRVRRPARITDPNVISP